MSKPKAKKEPDITSKAESLVHCLKEGWHEDAFSWCVEILNDLHSLEKDRRAKLEFAIRYGLGEITS